MFKRMIKKLSSEKGQGLPEYGLLLALIVLAVMATIPSVRDSIEGLGGSVSDVLDNKADEVTSQSS